MPGRPPKTLLQHIEDGTFRPSRHADLLATHPLTPRFAEFAQRSRDATSERERRAVALDFRDAIAAAEVDADDEAAKRTFERIMNMPPEPFDHAKDRARAEREARANYARAAHSYGIARNQAEEAVPLSVREIASRLGVSCSTVRRYLAEIAERERLYGLDSGQPGWEFGKRS